MGRQARIKKERRNSRAQQPRKLLMATIPFEPSDTLGDDGLYDDCPLCREMREMGLGGDDVHEVSPEQSERLMAVMRELRDTQGVPAFFADEQDDPD